MRNRPGDCRGSPHQETNDSGSELFPARVRSAANAMSLAAVVVGSAVGLGLTALIADDLGVRNAIALLAIGPLLAAFVVAMWFPETARLELEQTSADH